jgi:anaerobic dimethyl sulfoxide reductase subunit B (iron-sulfur subunit)
MQIGSYFDQSRCTGCYTCSIACKDWHDIKESAVQWRRIIPLERGRYPDVYLSYVSLSCNHCQRPACAEACPAGAITKREEDGIIIVDQDQCLGKNACEMFCKQACPYDVPQFGSDENSRVQMCTLCVDRLAEKKNPVCVDACPMRALDFGPMDELKKKYGDVKEVEGFSHSEETNPSIIFKPRY